MAVGVRTAAFGVIMLLGVSTAMAATAAGAARYSARKRGYTPEQTRCFVPLFVQYASLNRQGRWTAGGKRKSDVYRHEVYAKCGVMR